MVVLDTDVVSFAFRVDSRYDYYREHVQGNTAFISFMTFAELLRGSLHANWGDRRRNELMDFVKEHFVIIDANRLMSEHWAKLTDQANRNGKVLKCADGWVAATAATVGAPLLNHNARDFTHLTGLTVISDVS